MIAGSTPGAFRRNRLKVITFNFDRSFERLLFLALRASYGLSTSDTIELVMSVPVFHVHGDLGRPAWLYPNESGTRDYSRDSDVEVAVAASQRIRLVHEEVATERLASIWTDMEEAERLYSIGFGFDPINMERLRIDQKREAVFRATAYGCTPAELEPVRRFCNLNLPHLYPEWQASDFVRNVDLVHD